VPLRREHIPRLGYKMPWFLVTTASGDEGGEHRVKVFTPADLADSRSEIIVLLSGELDKLKTKVTETRSYRCLDITCGQFESVNPKGSMDFENMDWRSWGVVRETDAARCQQCSYQATCKLPPRAKPNAQAETRSVLEVKDGAQR
jgi:hypothetical protein